MAKQLSILGIRGIPAAHGGFETFAERLALYLTEKGWDITVYCQEEGEGRSWTDAWQGVRRIHIPVKNQGPLGTIIFDLRATIDAARRRNPCLTLGYNTAIFCTWLRLFRVSNVINMDGIEWSRAKWGAIAKTWFWLNDWLGCWLGNHLVADHPAIREHLMSRVRASKITTIAYGAEKLLDAPTAPLAQLGISPGSYLTVIARAEPENSILEIVQGFSARKRDVKLVVLGNYSPSHPYQMRVMEAASEEVIFAGAIYDKEVLQSLRYHSLAYIHGHQVGGTNPSLVEALGAGNAVIAHDNRFNRWVAGDNAVYFSNARELDSALNQITDAAVIERMRLASSARFEQEFTWPQILAKYEMLLQQHQVIAPSEPH